MQQMVLPQGSTRLFERSCSHRFFVIMKEKSQQPEKPATGVISGGDGGIRTHGPLRIKRFRVVLVMTTSIRLHIMTASLLLRMEKSLVYYDTTSWKRQGETFRFLVVKKVHRSGLPLRWTDRANRFVLIHTHSSKRISYPASPMPLCRARCCRLALPTLAPAQDAQDSPAADHQHPCP